MAKPKAKGVTNLGDSAFGGIGSLYRNIAPFVNPSQGLDGNIWRNISRSQPIIQDNITTLKMYIQGLPYDIRARDSEKQDELKDDILRHKEILENCQDGDGFLEFLDLVVDDFEQIPFGAGTEVQKYSDGELYTFRALDGATLYPFWDNNFRVVQYVPEIKQDFVFFTDDELVRMKQNPRPELYRKGWQIAPPEKIYLAIELLNRGDRYYAQLLLDTPEAGLLDLGDMSKESAEKWIESFKNLFTGIDAFKIPVLYEHTIQAKYLPFNRPPTDLLFDQTTFKYAQITCAAFGLTVGDIGLKNSNGSLSSDIRDERHSKGTGKAFLKKKIETLINKIIPSYLQFWFIDTDDELLVSKGRARAANAIAGRNLIESGALTPNEWRAQLKADGLITIPLSETPKDSDFDILKDISGLNDQLDLQKQQIKAAEKKADSDQSGLHKQGGQAGFALNKRRNVRGGRAETVVGKEPSPASQGGMGEIKSLAEDSETLSDVLKKIFSDLKYDNVKVRRLIKSVIPKMELSIKSALETSVFEDWKINYIKELFDLESNFEDKTLVSKSIKDTISELEEYFSRDEWWKIVLDDTEIGDILIESYRLGLADTAEEIQNALYENGYIDSKDLNKKFALKNEELRKSLYQRAVILNELLNSGTKYYITRIAISSVLESVDYFRGLGNSNIEGDEFINLASSNFVENFKSLLEDRVDKIGTFETFRAYNEGVLKQYRSVGFKEKIAQHLVDSEPCEECKSNINLGYVPMDYLYPNKMGEQVEGSPFHLNCLCSMGFSIDELKIIMPDYFIGD